MRMVASACGGGRASFPRRCLVGILQREASFLAPEWQDARDLYEVALKFVLSDSRVHAGIVGMRFPHEVDQNVKLLQGWTPAIDFATMPRLTFEVYKAEDETL